MCNCLIHKETTELMWPLYIFFNKLLKLEELDGEEAAGGYVSVVETYPFKLLLNKKKYDDEGFSNSYYIEVPHVNQLYSWDCGLACVAMILRALGISSCDIQDLEDLCCTTSIWTVDLAYLLLRFSVKFSYYTVTLGANPMFSVETFYKDQLSNDLVRVNVLFQKARASGISIECRSISAEEISLLILSRKFVAIALVDQYKLSRSWLEDVCISDIYSDKPGYAGHYIIICGYSADTDEFEIRDPASPRKNERITSRRLDEARKTFGTDEDLLLISLEKEEGQSIPPCSHETPNC